MAPLKLSPSPPFGATQSSEEQRQAVPAEPHQIPGPQNSEHEKYYLMPPSFSAVAGASDTDARSTAPGWTLP